MGVFVSAMRVGPKGEGREQALRRMRVQAHSTFTLYSVTKCTKEVLMEAVRARVTASLSAGSVSAFQSALDSGKEKQVRCRYGLTAAC